MSGVVNGMTISSRHPDALLVRMTVFAKNGTDVRSPSVSIFAQGRLFLPVMPDPDPASPSFEMAKSGSSLRS
ncbi:MAG TPA: hypothetical protein P5224_09995 [Mesotoga sp.]|jgi:hypothetical protein|nr:hypothetical protein [Thermotogaceae bacterium]HRR44855.1 hypothetical protein [Mesotoga sp.]